LVLKQEQYEESQRRFFGLFHVHGYVDDEGKEIVYEFSKTAFWCLSDTNPLRIMFVWIATWKWFDYFITLAIVANSIMLATTDYEIRLNPDHESTWTPT